jgi:hypothetical protein
MGYNPLIFTLLEIKTEKFNLLIPLKIIIRLGTVAHACNLIYLGGRDQEDCSSKPA